MSGLPIPAYHDREALDHARRWLAHVESGRIGSPCRPTATLLEAGYDPGTTREQEMRHLRNELIVRGRVG